MAEPIPIIGGTGALGYGLAVRWTQAGEQIVIGSRKAERAAEAADRVRAVFADAEVEGLENAEAADQGPDRLPHRAVPRPVGDARPT